MRAVAPASCRRVPMEPVRPCLPGAGAAGSKPRPSSETTTATPSASLRISMRRSTLPGPSSPPACRRELRSASMTASARAWDTAAGTGRSTAVETASRASGLSDRICVVRASKRAETLVAGRRPGARGSNDSSVLRAACRSWAESSKPAASETRTDRMWSWTKLLERRWATERAWSAARLTACRRRSADARSSARP